MPVGPYDTFDECVNAIMKKEGVSEESARKICGKMEKDSKGQACGDCAAKAALARGQVTYQARGPCAIDPRALGQALDPLLPRAGVAPKAGELAVVDICGPLVHHFAWGLDSYDAIVSRVREACASPAAEVVLRIDSPGGDVYGVFEAAREIAALCKAAGKPLCAYVSGAGTSAAYALACAADTIYASATSCTGSIGVIDLMVSVVRQDAALGVDTATITSGERKADGNPHVPLSEAAVAAHQSHVDDLAAVFFAWVAERRPLSVEAVRELQAAVFVGGKAIDAGLVDEVADFHALQEIRKSGTIDATARNVPQGTQAMATPTTPKASSKYVDAMAALAAAAEDGDERARAAMKKMAAANDEKDGDEAPASSKPKPDAKAEGDKPAEDKKEAQASATLVADVSAVKAAVEVLAANDRKRAEDAERAAIRAARPDLANDPKFKASFETATLETLKAIVALIPKAELTPAAEVKPTRGATAGASVPAQGEGESAALKRRMGLAPDATASVTRLGENADCIVFGATPEQIEKIRLEKGY